MNWHKSPKGHDALDIELGVSEARILKSAAAQRTRLRETMGNSPLQEDKVILEGVSGNAVLILDTDLVGIPSICRVLDEYSQALREQPETAIRPELPADDSRRSVLLTEAVEDLRWDLAGAAEVQKTGFLGAQAVLEFNITDWQ